MSSLKTLCQQIFFLLLESKSSAGLFACFLHAKSSAFKKRSNTLMFSWSPKHWLLFIYNMQYVIIYNPTNQPNM